MRRVLALAALGFAVLAGAAYLGWRSLARAAPDMLRDQLVARLSEALATAVELGPVAFHFDTDGIELAASDLRAYPSVAGPALRAERVEIQIDFWSLLAGQVRVQGIELSGPQLRLRRAGSAVEIDGGEPGAEGPIRRPSGPAAAPKAGEQTGDGGRTWRDALAGIPQLSLSGGRVDVLEAGGRGRDLSVESLEASLARRWIRGGFELTARGELRDDGDAAGRFRLEAHAADASAFDLEVDELALGAAGAWLGGATAALAPRGRATGSLHVEIGARGPSALALDLSGTKVHLEPRLGGAAKPIDLASVRLTAKGAPAGRGWSVRGRGTVGRLVVPFEATLGAARLERLALTDIDLAGLAPLAAALAEPDRSRVGGVLGHLRGGSLESVELAFADPAERAQRPVQATWRVTGASIDAGDASRLEAVTGEGSFDGDVLELRDVRAQLKGQPLPALDLRVAGLAQIHGLAELRCVAPASVGALPGRVPLAQWAAGDDEGPHEPSWRRLALSLDWLEHPALLCAAERLRGELRPDREHGGVQVTLDRAVWAGVPIRGVAQYRVRPEERAELRLDLGPPFEPSLPTPRASGWARGRFEFETTSLGHWRVQGASGTFLASGDRLRLDPAELRLDPGPGLHGSVELDLSVPERVPFVLDAVTSGGTLEDLYAAGGWSDHATGSFVGSARLAGGLRPGHPVLGDARGAFSLHARDGVIRQKFTLLLAVGMASETLNPFRERGTIRYDAMDAQGRVEDGGFAVDAFAIDGPALRAAASGRIGATDSHDTQLVMGLYFFRTLDTMLGSVPILNRIVLGNDQNLIGAYVAITGPWDKLGASVIPMKTLMKGPVGFVFEGLPSFVMGSLRRVQTLLPVAGEPAPKEDS